MDVTKPSANPTKDTQKILPLGTDNDKTRKNIEGYCKIWKEKWGEDFGDFFEGPGVSKSLKDLDTYFKEFDTLFKNIDKK